MKVPVRSCLSPLVSICLAVSICPTASAVDAAQGKPTAVDGNEIPEKVIADKALEDPVSAQRVKSWVVVYLFSNLGLV